MEAKRTSSGFRVKATLADLKKYGWVGGSPGMIWITYQRDGSPDENSRLFDDIWNAAERCSPTGSDRETSRNAAAIDKLADAMDRLLADTYALPQFKRNPEGRKMATAKKPSVAQLAARKRFAEMAKAGVFTKSAGRRKNPAKKRAAKPVTRPSQASGKKPTKRLVARRVATKKAPAGFFANPKKREFGVYLKSSSGVLKPYAKFPDKKKAVEYAQAKADQSGYSFVVKPI